MSNCLLFNKKKVLARYVSKLNVFFSVLAIRLVTSIANGGQMYIL